MHVWLLTCHIKQLWNLCPYTNYCHRTTDIPAHKCWPRRMSTWYVSYNQRWRFTSVLSAKIWYTHDCIEWLFLAESKQKWLLMTVSLLVPLSQQINRRQLHIAMTALHILVKPCVPTGTVAQSVKTVTWYYLQYTYRQHSLKCKKLERSIFVQL